MKVVFAGHDCRDGMKRLRDGPVVMSDLQQLSAAEATAMRERSTRNFILNGSTFFRTSASDEMICTSLSIRQTRDYAIGEKVDIASTNQSTEDGSLPRLCR